MESSHTLLLQRSDVARLLHIDECMAAVEQAFRLHAEGRAGRPKVLGLHTDHGGFHIKAGILELQRPYFVAKVNSNFPGNPKQYDLPTIQGVIVVCDATNGRLLALMDSIEITIIRTGAATGVATKYLAPPDATVATICGCGNQGRISLKAIMKVRKLKKVYAFDLDRSQTERFANEFNGEPGIIKIGAGDLRAALQQSQIIVTCTTSKAPFIHAEDILPGSFIAAVGADSEEKQELFSDLLVSNKIVVDLSEQSASIGEVHHAIRQNLITASTIYAELGCIIAGKKPGRESDREIIIFDSTGTALQDVAAAAIVYEKALLERTGMTLDFSRQEQSTGVDPLSEIEKDTNALKLWFPFR